MADVKQEVQQFKINRSEKLESQARKLFAYAKRDEIACGTINSINMERSYENWFVQYTHGKLDADIEQLNKRMEAKQDMVFLKLRKQGVSENEASKIAYNRPLAAVETAVTQAPAKA